MKCQCDACVHRVPNADETVFPYTLHQPRLAKGTAQSPVVRLESREDEIFRGYRRVQIIAQTMALLHIRYPSLQLIQDFRSFADLLEDVSTDTWSLLPKIMELRTLAAQHLLRASKFPAFSTISQIEESRRKLNKETLDIRKKIDQLMEFMFDDEEARDIVNYIKQSMRINLSS